MLQQTFKFLTPLLRSASLASEPERGRFSRAYLFIVEGALYYERDTKFQEPNCSQSTQAGTLTRLSGDEPSAMPVVDGRRGFGAADQVVAL